MLKKILSIFGWVFALGFLVLLVGFIVFSYQFGHAEYEIMKPYIEQEHRLLHQVADNPNAHWIKFAEHENYSMFYDAHSIDSKTHYENIIVPVEVGPDKRNKRLTGHLSVWMKMEDSLREETEVTKIYFICKKNLYAADGSIGGTADITKRSQPRSKEIEPWGFSFNTGDAWETPSGPPESLLVKAICKK